MTDNEIRIMLGEIRADVKNIVSSLAEHKERAEKMSDRVDVLEAWKDKASVLIAPVVVFFTGLGALVSEFIKGVFHN